MKTRNELLNQIKTELSNDYYLNQRDEYIVNDCVDKLLEAINYTHCSLQLKAKINKEIEAMSEVLKEVEDNEELFLKDKNEWYRQKNIAEGKIAILISL